MHQEYQDEKIDHYFREKKGNKRVRQLLRGSSNPTLPQDIQEPYVCQLLVEYYYDFDLNYLEYHQDIPIQHLKVHLYCVKGLLLYAIMTLLGYHTIVAPLYLYLPNFQTNQKANFQTNPKTLMMIFYSNQDLLVILFLDLP